MTSNPLASMGSNVFVRRYKDERGIWHEERQVNLGGEQGTVTYVHLNDYTDAKAEIERLRAALGRVDKLMIRERQSNKGYVREVRKVIHEALRGGVERHERLGVTSGATAGSGVGTLVPGVEPEKHDG